jgi:hypothetical protein
MRWENRLTEERTVKYAQKQAFRDLFHQHDDGTARVRWSGIAHGDFFEFN